MLVEIIDGKARLTKQAESVPAIQRLKKIDKTKGKASFEMWLRYLYFSYDKDSIYRNYLPKEREKKVVEMLFPDKSVTYFKKIAGLSNVASMYIEMTYTFKELLYRRLLSDIEEMLDELSQVKLTRQARVKGRRRVSFYSQIEGKQVSEDIDLDVMVKIDNSDEKIKVMDNVDKLLKREVIIKKALKEEQIEADLKKAADKRLFDN